VHLRPLTSDLRFVCAPKKLVTDPTFKGTVSRDRGRDELMEQFRPKLQKSFNCLGYIAV
jgi:hypothetical protein